MTKILIAAVLFGAFARVAGAQPLVGRGPSTADDHGAPNGATARLLDGFFRQIDLPPISDWLKGRDAEPPNGADRRWLSSTPLQLRAGTVAPRTAAVPMGGRKISRTFVPIPLFRFQRYSSLVTPRGFFAINSSIVIGRRNTWALPPARGGRTFGIAVQMRMWLDRPASPGQAASVASVQDRIVSTLRAVIERSGN